MKEKIDRIWEEVKRSPHHGVCVHLSSIHTKNSCGIGEYLDLIPLIDYLAEVGMDTLQLLPLNDSGYDPSPYNAQSGSALHPIYLSLKSLPGKLPPLPQLSMSGPVAYKEVLAAKYQFLREYIEENEIAVSSFANEFPFLKPFALFKVLKNIHGNPYWQSWSERDLTHRHYKELLEEHSVEVNFYLALQMLCYDQMKQVKKHAQEKGVLLKGDIPILLSPDSADVWHEREFFNLDLVAGAPPDDFTPEGQYWGFPLYNWDNLARKNYSWWKERLKFASNLYDLYRVDHVIGFFRIWALQKNGDARKGHFIPDSHELMLLQGQTLLNMLIDSSEMLPIAEDLGLIPPGVRETLTDLEICGMRLFRWERTETGGFVPYDQYQPLTMTTISTHDTETLTLWWEDNLESVDLFTRWMQWDDQTLTFEKRLQILKDNHHTPSYFHVNLLQEYLALYEELVWDDPEADRINVPGKLLPTNWVYRMRPSIEEITAHKELKSTLRSIVDAEPK
ncbi:MAG: 4-alpha-glucanotransferase [Chlamydiia bacterium]|nr:4-alpha-glucanotransferase [Chlamydiia bacterium]MCH9615155.1 4-alpha-glucanotransferase [Chlamydiia bacterium]MCH9628523.1 4-alpha-glucanotransferase [Chlamydiia bacterium]